MNNLKFSYSKFKNLLNERNVTAYQVSKETGVTTATLSEWKIGKYTPKIDKLLKIAQYFGVSVEYFLDGYEKNNEEYLLNRLKELENENLTLKNQVKELKGNTLGWENLRYLINDELKVLNLKENRPYGNFEGKITSSIAQIIREIFNYKFTKDLNAEHYDKAKEITYTIIRFAIDNFVIDDSYIARKMRGEIKDERINNFKLQRN